MALRPCTVRRRDHVWQAPRRIMDLHCHRDSRMIAVELMMSLLGNVHFHVDNSMASSQGVHVPQARTGTTIVTGRSVKERGQKWQPW
jgi:hypothetical protein